MGRVLLLIAIASVLAGCGGSGGKSQPSPVSRVTVLPGPPRPSTAPLDPARMRPLPAQGLLVPREHDLLLVGLNGKAYGRLPGFRYLLLGEMTSFDKEMTTLSQCLPGSVFVSGPGGRWYELGGHPATLRGFPAPRLPLPAGYKLVAHFRVGKNFLHSFCSLERDGEVVAATRDRFVQVLLGGRLVQVRDSVFTGGYVMSLSSGRKWKFPRDCTPLAPERDLLVALCRDRTGVAFVARLAADGSVSRRSSTAVRIDQVISARLSPDGRWILAYLGVIPPACGTGNAYLVSALDGSARPIASARFSSYPIGWADNGKAVVEVTRLRNCKLAGQGGTYLVDPKTLERVLVYPQSSLPIWNPAPPG